MINTEFMAVSDEYSWMDMRFYGKDTSLFAMSLEELYKLKELMVGFPGSPEWERPRNTHTYIMGILVQQIIEHKLLSIERAKEWAIESRVTLHSSLLPKFICQICKQDGSELVACKYCDNLFHEHHIKEWLKVRGECPVCHEPLKEKQLNAMQRMSP